jgi:hypothetical protein
VKLLVHLVPRRGAEAEAQARLSALGREIASRAAPDVASVATMWRLPGDPFGGGIPFAGALEVRGTASATAESLIALAAGLAERFGEAVHADLSTALVGQEHALIACERAPVRYQYLMRRREGFTHAAYLRRYLDLHSKFGFRTPAIRGYVQLHVEPDASRAAAGAADFGGCEVDSVSELHMDSLEAFLAAVSRTALGAEAAADEELFVDRASSFAFASRVAWHEVGAG